MRILVLLHAQDKGARAVGYVLWAMVKEWESAGHTVEVRHGPDGPLDADVVFLHVDLTVTPPEYLAAVAGHPCVVNRRVTDISKLRVTRSRVSGPGDGDGPVIVKTVKNHGGKPERALAGRNVLGRARDALARRGWLPLAYADWLDPYAYPIFPNPASVPAGVYQNPALFVERFLPERKGELYGLRSWSFLGDRSVAERYWAREPIVKRRGAVAWEDVEPPYDLQPVREEMGFDYGKFDYVVHDGRSVLLDVNRSPAFGHSPERLARQGALLAPGLESLLEAGGRPRPS